MSNQHISDFEMGYEYVRKHYSFLAKESPQYLRELGTAFFQAEGTNNALSKGMGCYFLELAINMILAENAFSSRKEDCL